MPGETYRLTDIDVREVSFVDRAANKRRFLIVKRSTEMPKGAEVVQRADGTMTTSASPAPVATSASASDGTLTEPTSADKAVSLTNDAKEVLGAAVVQAIEMLSNVKALIDGATMVETESEMSVDEIASTLAECTGLLEDVGYALLNVSEPAAEGQEPPPAPAVTGKRFAVRRAKRVLDLAKLEAMTGTLVQKYGVKMRKERLERFRQAMSLLSGIMTELSETAKATDEKAKGQVAKSAVTTQATDMTAVVAALQKQVGDLTSRLAAMRENAASSNSVPIECAQKAEEPVSWPLDINMPLSRGTVKKSDFFGED